MLPRPVEDALYAVIKSIGRRVSKFAVVGERPDYWVIDTEADDVSVIVKLAGPNAIEPLFADAAAPHRVAERLTSLPLASILASDDSCSMVPFRYMVKTRIEGEPWFLRRTKLSETEKSTALAAIGEAVAELHQPTFPTFGSFEPDGAVLPVALLTALKARAELRIRSSRLRHLFLEVLARRSDVFVADERAGINHDDLHGYNILFDPIEPTRVATILDFDKGWCGPIENDLAKMELWTGMTGPAFMAAYRAVHPQAPGYDDRRPVYQLFWCLEYAEPSPEHLAITNALCRELRLHEISNFS